MTKKPNMLSSVTPWDTVAQGYSETTMKMFAGYIEEALRLAGLNRNHRILDVACGPGTLPLAAAEHVESIHAIDFSQAMVEVFKQAVIENRVENIEIRCGDGQALPYEDEQFDAAFSMFGLMFFPDRGKGYAEIYRTLKPGGKVVISSWAPVADSPAMQTMFGALKAIKPELPEPQTDIESLENPEFFKDELANAGFRDIEIHRITKGITVDTIDKFWQDMVRGSAPIVMMKNSMPAEEWQDKEQLALQYLAETIDILPTSLTSDAWLAFGVK